jgi:hypothetical protein
LKVIFENTHIYIYPYLEGKPLYTLSKLSQYTNHSHPSHVESKLKNSFLYPSTLSIIFYRAYIYIYIYTYTLTLRVANDSTCYTAAFDSKGLRVEKEGRNLRVGSRIPLGMSPTKF